MQSYGCKVLYRERGHPTYVCLEDGDFTNMIYTIIIYNTNGLLVLLQVYLFHVDLPRLATYQDAKVSQENIII